MIHATKQILLAFILLSPVNAQDDASAGQNASARKSAPTVTGNSTEAQQRSLYIYSRAKEATLGASLASDFLKRTTPLGSAHVQSYLDGIGTRISERLADGQIQWTLAIFKTVSNGSTHEPLALPGGYIFVGTDLFLAANNEAEFAGMLAHAMAHVVARHGTRQATRGQIANFSSIPLIFMGGWSGTGGNDALLLPQGFLKIHREYELEADTLAVNALSLAGYDPRSLLEYISRTQSDASNSMRSALPPRSLRLENIEKAISAAPFERSAISMELSAVQEEVRHLMTQFDHETEPPSLLRRKSR